MCSLHLTHPSAHTHTHTRSSEQSTLWRSSWGFGALLKGLTSVVDIPAGAEIRTQNLGLQVRRSIH